jgi:hypothetical protein
MGNKRKNDGPHQESMANEFRKISSQFSELLNALSDEEKQLSLDNYEKEDRAYAELEDERIKKKIAKQKAKVRKLDAITARFEAQAQSTELDNNLRRSFSNKIYFLLAGWMIFIAAIFTLNGIGLLEYSVEVLITLLSSTTVTVVGIFMVVARNIFPLKGKNEEK